MHSGTSADKGDQMEGASMQNARRVRRLVGVTLINGASRESCDNARTRGQRSLTKDVLSTHLKLHELTFTHSHII